MSKKSKKKKNKHSILTPIDTELNVTYDSLTDEIRTIQASIARYEYKELRKARKKLKKDPNAVINRQQIKADARLQAVDALEKQNILQRTEDSFRDFSSACIMLARCIAALIVCILSIDCVKSRISPEMLNRINAVYQLAIKIR